MNLQEVHIQFPSLTALIDFTLKIDVKNYEINQEDFVLTGLLTEKDIELAENGFNAVQSKN